FALPEASFRVRCSGGTYVRTLAHDLGQSLGTGAALARLRRLRSEPFEVDRALPMTALDSLSREEVLAQAGVPLDRALDVLPGVRLEAHEAEDLGFGRRPSILPQGAPVSAGPRSVVMRA